jgi:hypothetical protein
MPPHNPFGIEGFGMLNLDQNEAAAGPASVDTGFGTTPVTVTVSPAPAPTTVETEFADLSGTPAPVQQTPTVNTGAGEGLPDFHPSDEAAAGALTPHEGGVSVTLEMLGRHIVARIEAGDKSAERATQMYISAGLKLIEAKRLVPNFKNFLRDHCNNLSRSRAYELIKIANGKSEEVRSNNRTRDHRRREKAAGVREPRTPSSPVKKPQPPKSQAQRALAEFKVAVDVWFSKMDDNAKREAVEYVIASGGVTLP